jgi:hypothetical protein
MKRTARILLVIFITIILLLPVIICNSIKSITVRIIIIVLSNILLQTILASFIKSTAIELIIAGAT